MSQTGLFARLAGSIIPTIVGGHLQMADHPLAKRLGILRQMAAEARRDFALATSTEERLRFETLVKSWDEIINEIVATIESKH